MSITPATIVLALCFAVFSAYLAYQRKRSPYKWFFIGFFFGLFGLFAAFFSPPKRKATRRRPAVPAAPIPKPMPVIRGPSDKFWYYLDPSHQQLGPMSHSALASAFREGKISPSTYVWNEEMTEWRFLKEFI